MSRRIFNLLAAAALGACLWSQSASAEGRFALVIGNASYRAVSQLANPVNDAKAVTQVLSTAGFEVISATNLTQDDMRRAIADFSTKISGKGPDTVALVFYAGHGLQVEGENFLVPVDARIEQEDDVSNQTMRLSDIMKELENAPARMRIVILDACRNNPFTAVQKSTGRGLAMVDAPTGSIVAYSTAPGAEALDSTGTGTNSPYTTALLETMTQPGLQIEQLFKRVRLSVHKATDGRQTPWESSSLTTNFAFFNPANTAVAEAKPAADKPVVVASVDPQATGLLSAGRLERVRALPVEQAYDLVIEEDSVEFYEEFVRLYSSHPLGSRIRRILFRRNQMVAWRNATVSNTADAYASYASLYPNSDLAATAFRLRIKPRVRPIDPIIVRLPKFPSQNNGQVGNSRPGGFPGQNNGASQGNNGKPGGFPGQNNGNGPGNNGKPTGIPLPGQNTGNGQANNGKPTGIPLPGQNAGNGQANNGKPTGIPLPGQNTGNGQANNGKPTGIPLPGQNAGNGQANNGKPTGIPLPGQNAGNGQADNGKPAGIPIPGQNAGNGQANNGKPTGIPLPGQNAGAGQATTGKPGGIQIPGQIGNAGQVNNGRPGTVQVPGTATGQVTTVRPGTIQTPAVTNAPSQVTTVRPGTIQTPAVTNAPSQITTVRPGAVQTPARITAPSQITTVRPTNIPASNAVPAGRIVGGAPVTQQRITAPVAQPRIATPQVQPRIAAPQVQQRFTAPQVQQRFTAPVAQPRISAPVAQPRISAPSVQPRFTAPAQRFAPSGGFNRQAGGNGRRI
jgi:Caspase domain